MMNQIEKKMRIEKSKKIEKMPDSFTSDDEHQRNRANMLKPIEVQQLEVLNEILNQLKQLNAK